MAKIKGFSVDPQKKVAIVQAILGMVEEGTEQPEAIGKVAAALMPEDQERRARLKVYLGNWVKVYQEAKEQGIEPFPGKGRREAATYHVTEKERARILQAVGNLSL